MSNEMPLEIKVFDDFTTYLEWCRLFKLDPNDDLNMISWSEMENNK